MHSRPFKASVTILTFWLFIILTIILMNILLFLVVSLVPNIVSIRKRKIRYRSKIFHSTFYYMNVLVFLIYLNSKTIKFLLLS